MNRPKVLVGCPTSVHKAYCLEEYIKSVKRLSYDNYDILIVDNSEEDDYAEKIRKYGVSCEKIGYFDGVKRRLAESRNVLRKKVLEDGYDYFLSLEQDVIPPEDIIEKLIRHKRLVVSAVYTKMFKVRKEGKIIGEEERPVLWGMTKEGKIELYPLAIREWGKLIRIFGGGLGCILIHRSVLEKTKFRIGEDEEGCDDLYFFRDILKNRIKAVCDTTVYCKHLERKWTKEIRKS